MKKSCVIVFLCVSFIVMIIGSCFAQMSEEPSGPPVEWWRDIVSSKDDAILSNVSFDYNLTKEQEKLLYVIRKVENGGPGREMGVLTKEAQRFKGDYEKSLDIQARWAAGTIRKRYDGDLKSFADRWCPVGAKNDPTGLNKNWYKNAFYYMSKGGA